MTSATLASAQERRLSRLIGVIYVCHPVSGDVPGNLARALRWLRWASRTCERAAVIAPWIANLQAGDDDSDPVQRTRGLANCALVATRCDYVLLVGGRVSSGMAIERDAAKRAGAEIIDLTGLGDEPPMEAP